MGHDECARVCCEKETGRRQTSAHKQCFSETTPLISDLNDTIARKLHDGRDESGPPHSEGGKTLKETGLKEKDNHLSFRLSFNSQVEGLRDVGTGARMAG